MSTPDRVSQRRPPSKPPLLEPSDQKGWQSKKWMPLVWYFVFMLAMLWLWQEAVGRVTTRTISYSQFKQVLKQGEVEKCAVGANSIIGTIQPALAAATNAPPAPEGGTPPQVGHAPQVAAQKATAAVAGRPPPYQFRTVRVDDPDLVRDLEKAKVDFKGVRPDFIEGFIWAWAIPIIVMVLLWRFLSRRMGNLGQSIMGFGSSQAKLMADKDSGVTFNDVAGCDEAKLELQEVVAFLKDPSRYRALGATIPKGILLVGPPGTGKTLLARAVAGEAKVPFFLISGSDFVEMFVGVGASRVRDLFAKAKALAPCIVFIDELDAVGRQRGVHLGAVNDEREQTLNQLLVGMDGFEANLGVIVMAATNRPEVLDRALLRPGRFDRQVVVDAPDLEGRLAILKLHSRAKPLAEDADLRQIARETPGFTGADLANLVNEAALLAARHHGRAIGHKDLEEAVEKVVAGPERKSRRLGEAERRRVAFHEVGHALVAVRCKHADPVHKITIIPRGRMALGYTLQLPAEDQYLLTFSELSDRLKGLLGGRAAEDVVFHEVSTGAENDLKQATTIARQMVAMFGMSRQFGLAHCAEHSSSFLSGAMDGSLQRDCSERTAEEIDTEVKKLLEQSYTEAKAILQRNRRQLDLVAGELLKRETLDAQTFRRLVEQSSDEDMGVPGAPNPSAPESVSISDGEADAVQI